MTGADFVARETVRRGSHRPGRGAWRRGDQPAFAFPANGIVVALWLDAADRVVREVLVSPNHLITRTFDYPPSG